MTQTEAAVQTVVVVAEAIRELREVPSGHLYARVMGRMSMGTYETTIRLLKGAGLVEEKSHVLRWVGPHLEKRTT